MPYSKVIQHFLNHSFPRALNGIDLESYFAIEVAAPLSIIATVMVTMMPTNSGQLHFSQEPTR
jgi:hypothetical protein